MERELEKQLRIIKEEGLTSCRANIPGLTEEEAKRATHLKSTDVRVLCAMAKEQHTGVILYCEYKPNPSDYVIDKAVMKEKMPIAFPFLEREVDEHNAQMEQVDFSVPHCSVFYFKKEGCFYFQRIESSESTIRGLCMALKKVNELYEKHEREINRAAVEEGARKEKILREEKERRKVVLQELLELVRKDPKFLEYDKPGHRRDYARNVFLENRQMEKYRVLFYAEDDCECLSETGQEKCYLELEKLYRDMQQEKLRYQQSAEYKNRLEEFGKVIQEDKYFWGLASSGYRRDYAAKVFLINKNAEPYRTLFFLEDDVNCISYEGKEACALALERIYKEFAPVQKPQLKPEPMPIPEPVKKSKWNKLI